MAVHLGDGILGEYQHLLFGGSSNPAEQLKDFERDLAHYIRQLKSIRDRLPLWADESTPDQKPAPDVRPRLLVDPSGPIFVVHGRNQGLASEVARVLVDRQELHPLQAPR